MLDKMGETIALFRLYRDTGEEEWSIRAEELLDDIWNGCTGDMSLAYGNGLCGIGARTEYLIQNGFVEGDTDEILAEIDGRVFAAINARPPFDLSIEQGISGLACYLYHRLCYRKDSEEPVVLNLKEYTIYLIDWIAEALQDGATGKDYYEVYFILVLLHTLNIMNAKIENYRTRYLNELLRNAQHSIVGIWDADVLIPEAQLIAGVWHILGGCVLCFPYNGTFRFLEKERSNAIRKNVDELQAGEGYCLLGRPSVGGAFLVNKTEYLEAGGENEGFYGWGPEDAERVKRLEILELPIARTKGALYHLHHERKPDIGVDNRKKAQHNQKVLSN